MKPFEERAGAGPGARFLAGAALAVAVSIAAAHFVRAQEGSGTVEFRIIFTANTLGYIEPCECTGGRLGGLDRRAAAVGRAREGSRPALLVDLGNLFELPGQGPMTELGRRRAEFLVGEMNYLDYAVQGIGVKEIVSAPELVERFLSDLRVPLLLTNRSKEAELRLETVPVYRAVLGGLKVDFFCIVDPGLVPREGIVVPWEEPLREGLRRSGFGADPADLQVVITHLPVRMSDRLPGEFPEIDLILDGTLILPRQASRIDRNVVVMSTAGKGQQVGVLDITAWKRERRPEGRPAILGFQGLQIRLPREYPADPEAGRRLRAFREQLVRDGLIPSPPPP